MTEATPPPAETTAVLSLVHNLDRERLGTGPLAALRRMEPAGVLPPAFWRVLIEHVPESLRDGPPAERAWAAIINGIALMAPRPHEHKVHPGTALATTGYSEPRFVRLLRAEGPGAATEIRTACRWLSTKAQPVDWVLFARFILSRLHPRFSGDDHQDRQTNSLARAYFAAQAKRETPSETAQP